MIVLSMLGTNDYKEISYTWDKKKARPHKFFQAALLEWFPQADALICVTSEAKEKHGQAVQQLLPKAQLIDIPSGKDEAEYWDIFNIIGQHIPSGAELVFDMTHGFRSLPTLALLAVSFLRAAKAVQLKHILYGAYEAKTDDIAPVFDLTKFVKMLDWASATNRFLDTGDASKFRPLVETRGAKPLNVDLNSAVQQLDSLSAALSTNRAMRIGELAQQSRKKIDQAQGADWEASHAPLKLLLPRLKGGLDLLVRDENSSQEAQLVQSFGGVIWFLRHRQYEKAIGLAREWMVCFVQWKQGGNWTQSLEQREQTERWLNDAAKNSSEDEWKPFVALWKNLGHFRNDLLHFGFRDAPRKEHAIPDEAEQRLKELKAIVRKMGLELREPS
ncbi:MAG: TIGR02221 family CRISPR-associated protein [Thermaceae bacterium]|nr:TIGR02221 family CRISPR-associated protein [Thermaceae bacterium]